MPRAAALILGLCLLASLSLLCCGREEAERTSLVWSTFLGADCSDEGFGIALDDAGHILVTGFTCSDGFPVTAGAFDTSFNGGTIDAFVIKLDPAGQTVRYATFLGGSGPDRAFGIAVDGSGSAYVTGRTRSEDFPVTPGACDTTQNGDYDLFVAKLAPTGGDLLYATFLGGSLYDKGAGIAVDRSGSAYLTGWTRSTDFPATAGAFDTVCRGPKEADAFAVKLDPAGSELVYATFLGGAGQDWGQGIAVDDSGCAHIGLLTGSADFPVTGGAFDTTFGGISDAAVVKLDAAGSGLVYATLLGAGGQDWGQSIAIDAAGHAVLAGVTHSPDFPVTGGAFDTSHNGRGDVFVARLNPAGSGLVCATLLGGAEEERSTGLALDDSGRAYLTGTTRSVDFPTTPAAFDTSYNGKADAFMAVLDPAGRLLIDATFFGGAADDASHGIAVNDSGQVYLTGWTESGDLPVTPGAFDVSYNGREDIFVVKFPPVNGPPD
jgi:hypothetical protein